MGFVRVEAGNVFVTPNSFNSPTTTAADIQRGIDVASSGDTVNVEAGTYVENGNFVDSVDGVVSELNIDKPLTLLGPNATFNPFVNPVPASAQAIILPGTSDPNPFDSTAITIIGVNASNVTIEGFTINGSNPALAGDPKTIVYNGVPINASEGISSYDDVGNITVSNNIVENTVYTGIDFQNGNNTATPEAATSDNLISQNLLQNLGGGGFGFGVGVLLYNNFYAEVNDNLINDNVGLGVQTGNFSQANPDAGFAPTISKNQITANGIGIFFNLMYSNTSTFTVADNSISATHDPSYAPWVGVLIGSIENSASVTFQDNTINGSAAYESSTQPSSGFEIWNTPTTGTVLISGGSISGVDYGIWVNSYEGFNSPAAQTSATVDGVSISASQLGVYVEDSYQYFSAQFMAAGNPEVPVSATIEGNTSITIAATGIGIEVDGADASVQFSGAAPASLSTSGGNYITLLHEALKSGKPSTPPPLVSMALRAPQRPWLRTSPSRIRLPMPSTTTRWALSASRPETFLSRPTASTPPQRPRPTSSAASTSHPPATRSTSRPALTQIM